MKIEQRTFEASGIKCAATLTLPDSKRGHCVPAVLTAPGFAGVKEMIIPDYSREFAERGVASLAFDYPGFGRSAGEPRQEVDPPQQLRAFRAALDIVAADPLIDRDRIGVWGTSLSGGHALMIAATDSRIRAVAAVIPFIYLTPNANVTLVPTVVKDAAFRLLRRPGLTIPVAGRPGEIAAMNSDGAYEWASDMAAGAPTYRNEVTVASLLKLARWSTRTAVAKLSVPTLIILAESDTITPPVRVRKALSSVRQVTYLSYPQSHFELFTVHGESVRRTTVDWVANQLCP